MEVGDEFDTLQGIEICTKYVVPMRGNGRTLGISKKTHSRVDPKFMPEHISTSNYFKYGDMLNENDHVIVTQKLHGTSIRIGHTIVEKQLNWYEKLLKKIGVNVKDTEYDVVFGSRKVIKDPNNPFQNHYYDYDLWTEVGESIADRVPENFIVYAEIVGWTRAGQAIQTGYTYEIPKGGNRLYIYRVAFINAKGYMVDLSWDQVKEFCTERGLMYVPEIWRGTAYMCKELMHNWIDVQLYTNNTRCLPVKDEEKVDEGVCVRRDGLIPTILKAKSPIFLGYETSLLDQEVVDLESSQSEQ